jgi:histidinol-phosphate/aromatic aminotransferase/cobyric acid decarboxylase-like protein
VLVKFQTGVDAYKHLEQNGIIVRRLATESEFRDCVRISVGLNKTMRKTKDVLRTL